MSEIDVISHLMDVENQASSLIFEAQTVAEKNISDARAKAETLYKEHYENLISEFESKYSQDTDRIFHDKQKSFEEYQQKTQSLRQDVKSFNELLESLLFEGKK